MKDGMSPAALQAALNGDVDNFFTAMVPGGIEAQEAQGQKDFVASEILPKECIGCSREDLESIGIVFGEDHDDLFVECQLPDGWKKEPTDHSMWSNLLDDKGRIRAHIFYKAAFYGRSAHIDLARFINIDGIYGDNPVSGKVVNAKGEVLFETEKVNIPEDDGYLVRDKLRKDCGKWLNDNYPDWNNNLAYWDL